jgi:hypothetical protein
MKYSLRGQVAHWSLTDGKYYHNKDMRLLGVNEGDMVVEGRGDVSTRTVTEFLASLPQDWVGCEREALWKPFTSLDEE